MANKNNEISLNEYLASFNKNRVLDKVITKWFQRKDKNNPKKSKEKWDNLLKSFYNETEKK